MSNQERPDFGPLQIKTPEDIKMGMVLGVFEEYLYGGNLTFVRVVRCPHEDSVSSLVIDVEYKYASSAAPHVVHQGISTESISLAGHSVIPLKDGTWSDSGCLVRVDQNGCIPDECLPNNFTKEAKERERAKASGKWTRGCVHWHNSRWGRGPGMDPIMLAYDFGQCDLEGKSRRCGLYDASDCPDWEPKKE